MKRICSEYTDLLNRPITDFKVSFTTFSFSMAGRVALMDYIVRMPISTSLCLIRSRENLIRSSTFSLEDNSK